MVDPQLVSCSLHCLHKIKCIHQFHLTTLKIFSLPVLALHFQYSPNPFELQNQKHFRNRKDASDWCYSRKHIFIKNWQSIIFCSLFCNLYLQENQKTTLRRQMTASDSCRMLQGLFSFQWGCRPCLFWQAGSYWRLTSPYYHQIHRFVVQGIA